MRKEEMLNDFKNIEKNIGNYKDAKARIDEREACHLRLGFKDTPGMTMQSVNKERKE